MGQVLRSALSKGIGCLCVMVMVSAGCGHGTTDVVFDPRDLLGTAHLHGKHDDPRTLAEIDLGEFFVTRRESDEGGTIFIRFHLYGIVPAPDKQHFEEVLVARNTRMRDSVISLVQKSEIDHLADPSWGLIRSELIPTISKSLRTTALRDVVFTTFSMDGG